jgi:hypothetical protein
MEAAQCALPPLLPDQASVFLVGAGLGLAVKAIKLSESAGTSAGRDFILLDWVLTLALPGAYLALPRVTDGEVQVGSV